MYIEKSMAAAVEGAGHRQTCCDREGALPCRCAPLAFPYIPAQNNNPKRYDQREALQRGTLFPGLDLPFHREMVSRYPLSNSALCELMALDFAIDELGLYLVTHRDDAEVLELYKSYIRLADEGRKKYEAMYGPLMQTTVGESGYRWLDDPWPWEKEGNR